MKRLAAALCITLGTLSLLWTSSHAASEVRIKDIAQVLQARDNQLFGFGLVIGLRGSGDTAQTGFTKLALTNLLNRVGVVPQANIPNPADFRSRNVAAVMVTANLPPFIREGRRLDISVSSIGDSTSLLGGTLLFTPLQGANGDVYAVAQGAVAVGGGSSSSGLSFRPAPTLERSQQTVGRISGGAIVEKEVAVTLAALPKEDLSVVVVGEQERAVRIVEEQKAGTGSGTAAVLNIVLNQPDFTTAARVAYSLAKAGMDAKARDAATILVSLPSADDLVGAIARLEAVTVVPDSPAKVVINERTGTVVIGENVRVAPVAVTYGNVSVQISDIDLYEYTGGNGYPSGYGNYGATLSRSKIHPEEKPAKVSEVSGASLKDLIQSLNALGATPRDLIAILQAIKSAGALTAEV